MIYFFAKIFSSRKVHPSLKGVAYGSTIVAGLVGCYYNVIIAWCLFYLGNSIQVRWIGKKLFILISQLYNSKWEEFRIQCTAAKMQLEGRRRMFRNCSLLLNWVPAFLSCSDGTSISATEFWLFIYKISLGYLKMHLMLTLSQKKRNVILTLTQKLELFTHLLNGPAEMYSLQFSCKKNSIYYAIYS